MKRMKNKWLSGVVIGVVILLEGCSTTFIQTNTATYTPTKQPATEAPTAADTLAPTEPTSPPGHVVFTILYTNDEHGYMEGASEGLGAAELMGQWEDAFGYTPEADNFLVLSGGDMWTGPAISTWFNGASMVQVMNLMGYDASAVGNHEFDFGLDGLTFRSQEMDFPLLSANVDYKEDRSVPTDLGIQPFTILELEGLKIGVVGLSLEETPTVTKPNVVAPLEFTDYEEALREVVPQVWEAGADMVVVLAHVCRSEITTLAFAVQDLGIAFMGGGHCHEKFSTKVGDTIVIEGGAQMGAYGFIEFDFNTNDDTFEVLDYGDEYNKPGNPDPEVAALVEEWRAEADVILGEVVGYVDHTITQHSNTMDKLITATWLWAYPTADIALTNTGGIRDNIDAGEVTVGDLISVLPFENTLIELHLTGEELRQSLTGLTNITAMAGVEVKNGTWILTSTGEVLDPDQTYVVLVNDFMYAGGDNYNFTPYDPDGYDTSIPYRQPLIDWIKAQLSDADHPLDAAIEALIGG